MAQNLALFPGGPRRAHGSRCPVSQPVCAEGSDPDPATGLLDHPAHRGHGRARAFVSCPGRSPDHSNIGTRDPIRFGSDNGVSDNEHATTHREPCAAGRQRLSEQPRAFPLPEVPCFRRTIDFQPPSDGPVAPGAALMAPTRPSSARLEASRSPQPGDWAGGGSARGAGDLRLSGCS